jgi:hypothetical protein
MGDTPATQPRAAPTPPAEGFGDRRVDLPFGGGEAGHQVAAELLGLHAEPPDDAPGDQPDEPRDDADGTARDA